MRIDFQHSEYFEKNKAANQDNIRKRNELKRDSYGLPVLDI